MAKNRRSFDDLKNGVRKFCREIKRRAENTSIGWIATGVEILAFDRFLLEEFGLRRSDTIAFVRDETGLSRRSIFYFLSAAKVFGDLPAKLQGKIEVGAIKLLAARTVPAHVQEKARKLLETQSITIDCAREMIGKAPKKSKRAKQRRIALEGCTLIIQSEAETLDLYAILQQAMQQLESERLAVA